MSHTKTPWHLEDWDRRNVWTEDGRPVAICSTGRPPEDGEEEGEEQANAEFIVLACNAHEELLGVSKKLLRGLRLLGLFPEDQEELKRAIEKAEGKEK